MLKNKKAVLDYLKVYVFMAMMAFHNIAFAATDPITAFANVLNGIMGIMLFLALEIYLDEMNAPICMVS